MRKELKRQLADVKAQEARIDKQLATLQPTVIKPSTKAKLWWTKNLKDGKENVSISSRLCRGTALRQVVADKTGGVKSLPIPNVRVELGAFPKLVSREKSWKSTIQQSLASSQRGFPDLDLQQILSISWGFGSRAYALKPSEKPWRCFTLHTATTSGSLDLIADGDDVAMWWVVGLGLLCPDVAEIKSKGQFIWRRALMRIDGHCRSRAVTRSQALLKALYLTAQQRADAGQWMD